MGFRYYTMLYIYAACDQLVMVASERRKPRQLPLSRNGSSPMVASLRRKLRRKLRTPARLEHIWLERLSERASDHLSVGQKSSSCSLVSALREFMMCDENQEQ